MSGAEEREARSVALEKAYVHEVYEQISGTAAAAAAADNQRGRAWPKVKQFLSELEPGSLVCDVGCGNGKYLSVNPSVFKVGADRCSSLAEIAREKDHEVLVCDNLSLPFRDESFDAVLSVAVVHHFATTERRVGALRELARVLRIGGRLIISVWAMEQRHRKFESQDVLVPWHRPQHLSTPSLELTSTTTTTSEEDGPPPYHAYTQTSDSDSCRSAVRPGVGQRKRGRSRHKGRSIDPARPCSSSQSSSSLSSPNETCYSFVRRALQKLAGGKRGGSGHRPWFLDSWSSCTKEPPPPHRYDPDGCEDGEGDGEDIQDLPIELRRLEDDNQQQSQEQPPDPPQRRQTFACTRRTAPQEAILLNHKSKSLSDILTVGQRVMVRSRSSVPSLGLGTGPETCTSTSITTSTPPTGSSIVDVSVSTAISIASSGCTCTAGTAPGSTSITTTAPSSSSKPKLVKQKKSLCEEEMEEEGGDQPTDMRNLIKALPEFKVPGYGSARRAGNVFKQSSMNEELMSTERLREKERVRQNIQKQASLNEELIYRRHRTLDSLRDTFFSTSTAKRFQLLKNGLTNKLKSSTTGIEKVAGSSFKNGFVRILQGWKGGEVSPNPGNRPSPSDSSGTAVPPCTPPPDGKKSNNNFSTSEDNNKNNNNTGAGRVGGGERRHSREDGSDSSKDSSLQSDTSVDSEDSFASVIFVPKPDLQTPATDPSTSPAATNQISPPKSPQPTSPKVKQHTPPPTSPKVKQLSPPPLFPPPAIRPPAFTEETPLEEEEEEEVEEEEEEEEETEDKQEAAAAAAAAAEAESKQNERLKQIQELLRSRVGPVASGRVPSSVPRNAFPLVRRSSAMALGRPEPLAKPLPRLLSLELFNPETDDMDSDSSGVSSPDSISSVISVLTEEPVVTSTSISTTTTATITTTNTTSTMQHVAQGTPNEECVPILCSPSSLPAPMVTTTSTSTSPKAPEIVTERLLLEVQEAVEEETGSSESLTTEPPPRISPSSISLLEAAADVASSLEDAVDAVIQSSPRARRRKLQLLESNDPMLALQGGSGSSSGSSTWSLHKSDSSSRGSDWSLHKPDGGNKFLTSVTAATSPVVSNNNYPWSVSGHSPVGSRKVSPRAERRCYEDYGILEEEEVISVPEEEDTWDESCRQHLAEFAEKLSEKLLEEIDQYRRQTCCAPQNQTFSSSSSSSFHNKILAGLPEGFEHIDDPYLSRLSEELQDLTKLSEELQERSSFLASLNNSGSVLISDDGGFTNPGFYTATEELNSNNMIRDLAEQVRRHEEETVAVITVPDVISSESTDDFSGTSGDVMLVCSRQTSDDITEDLDTCVEVLSKGDEEQEEGEELFEQTAEETGTEQVQETISAVAAAPEQGPLLRSIVGSVVSLRPGYSMESSDAGDVSEQTGTSGSDCSRKDNNSAGGKTASSTTSLMESTSDAGSSERTTGSDCSRDLRYADRRTARCDGRSSSEEASVPPPSFPTRGPSLVRQKEPPEEPLTKTESCASSLSGSTSQESLPSDNGGGAITFHRYYHVFREGELDQLIERYVENLHIISSYYDHANWCVVAEKVHVWTI